jgi:hypothetical protein
MKTVEDGSDLMFKLLMISKEKIIYVAEDTIQERASKLHEGRRTPRELMRLCSRLRSLGMGDGCASQAVRTELAKWAEMLAIVPPTYSKIRALNHTRLLAVDKEPGVRPIGCGEIWMRLSWRWNQSTLMHSNLIE